MSRFRGRRTENLEKKPRSVFCYIDNQPNDHVFGLGRSLLKVCDDFLNIFSKDLAQRLIEACTSIAGLSLGSSAWFSRNLSVITHPGGADEEISPESASDTVSSGDDKSEPTSKPVSGANTGKHSTQALIVLADVLASLLDIVFGSEEKERVVNFLFNVMGNVTPYLRNHRYI